MGPKTITLAIVLAVTMPGLFGPGRPASGQQETNRYPPCGCFCGGSTPDYTIFNKEPCTGIIGSDDCREYLARAPRETLERICDSVRSRSGFKSYKASCPTFAGLCEEKKPPKCKERDFSSYGGPWFDPGAQGCQNLQDTLEKATWSPVKGGTCTYTLSACGRVAATYSINAVETKDGKVVEAHYAGFTPRELTALGVRPIRRGECSLPFFTDPTRRVPPQKVCCDVWQEAVRAGGPCNPEVDADCDGLPNNKDGHLMNSVPYYAPLGAKEQDEPYNPVDPKDFNPADFDPRPPGLGWDEVMPNEPCKECKWVALSGKLTCSPDARKDHEYKATWRCPTSGVERVVTKRVPARFPCTPPNRQRPRG